MGFLQEGGRLSKRLHRARVVPTAGTGAAARRLQRAASDCQVPARWPRWRRGCLARSEISEADCLSAPDLVDVEVANALRSLWLRKLLTDERFSRAIDGLGELDMDRYQHPAIHAARVRTGSFGASNHPRRCSHAASLQDSERCARGERNAAGVLTDAQRLGAKLGILQPDPNVPAVTQRELAGHFGVSRRGGPRVSGSPGGADRSRIRARLGPAVRQVVVMTLMTACADALARPSARFADDQRNVAFCAVLVSAVALVGRHDARPQLGFLLR